MSLEKPEHWHSYGDSELNRDDLNLEFIKKSLIPRL